MPLYLCENLPRLQKISMHIELDKQYRKLKKIDLQDTTLSLTFSISSDLSEQVEQVSIPLPCSEPPAEARIQNVASQKGTLSLDVSYSGGRPSDPQASNFMDISNSNNLWSVKDLLKKTPRNQEGVNQFQFLCQNCDATVLESSAYKFADMPSEFWHEMMEFWHCHKPHEEHHNHNQKNYNGKIVPRPGFVNIGSAYFQVADLDSRCKSCASSLGDSEGNILQIYKWKLKLVYERITERFPPHLYVYFGLLDKINSSGTRKLGLTTAGSSSRLAVWVTSVGLEISIGGRCYPDCLKILYREDETVTDDLLVVPEEVWTAFTNYLSKMNGMMPHAQRIVPMVEAEQEVEYKMAYLCSSPDSLPQL